MRRIGFLVNPIAGMGGRVGLKGTDGKVAEARDQGAEPRAPDRARDALEALHGSAPDVHLVTYGAPMGTEIAREAGFEVEVVGSPADPDATTAADTRDAVAAFLDAGVDLILFVGGDGTATDVASVLEEHGVALAEGIGHDRPPSDSADSEVDDAGTPMLGVPAGVKVYSSVFAVSPRAAGEIAASFTATEPAEVNDVDEDAFRGGEVVTELRAVVTVPRDDRRQSAKELGGGSVAGLAESVAEDARRGGTWVFGPGSTVGAVEAELGVDGSPLGVDVWRDGSLVVRDGGESAILDALGEDNTVVVSPIGGQGFVFGRGNQQLSPAVLRQCDVEIVASRDKLDGIGVLRVDTGDDALDEFLRGWHRVRVGAYETRLVEIV